MRKHFLTLILMALLPLAGWAADLDASKFVISNVAYGAGGALHIEDGDYTLDTEYTVDATKFYTSAACTEIAKDGEGHAYTLATLPINEYWVKFEGKGAYVGQWVAASFHVHGVNVTIDFTENLYKVFGTAADPAITFTLQKEGVNWDVTADVITDLGLEVSRAAGTNAGFYDYSFTWSNKNYAMTRKTGDTDKFEIRAKAITPTVELGTEVLTFNGANQAPTITVKDGTTVLPADDYTLTFKPDGGASYGDAHANATTYTVKATLKRNYSGNAESTGTFTIAQAPLTIYVNNFSVEYTAADANLATATFAYSGLQGADAANATPFGAAAFNAAFVSGDPGTHKNVASYNVKPVAIATNANYNNYAPTLLSTGKVTVTPKAITVKPSDGQTKTFGDADPVFTVDASAAYAGDRATVAGAYTVSRTNASVNTVGTYENVLTLSKKSGLPAATETLLKNYTITPGTANFQITGATLYVYPKNVTITYGDEAPELVVIATTAGGTEVTLDQTPTVKFKGLASAPTAAGTYVLTLEGAAAKAGYETINKLDGQYIINKKALTVTPVAQVLHVGDKVTNLNQAKVEYEGLVEGDKIGYALSFNAGGGEGQIPSEKFTEGDATKALLNEAVGTYNQGIVAAAAAGEGIANGNYTITWAKGALTVGGSTAINFLADDDDWAEIVKFDDKTATAVTLKNRADQPLTASLDGKWKAEEWNTIILPFKTNARKISAAFGYAIINVVDPDNTSTGNVQFKLQMKGDIPANTPIAIKTDADIAAGALINFGNIAGEKIVKPASKKVEVNAGAGHKFVGVYETVKIDKNTPNYHFLVNGGWKHIGASSTRSFNIVPFNCYLDQSNASAARELIFTFEEIDGTTTAIKAVEADVMENSSVNNVKEGWYTLQGVKLDSAPTEKGIYIFNGKKVMVK